MSAKYKFDLTGAEPIIRDTFAQAGTYQDGELLIAAIAEEGGIQGAGGEIIGNANGAFYGVSNQGETLPAPSGYGGLSNDGATLAGTQAGGNLDTLKVIVNPYAVYSVEYDQSAEITWSAVTDTTVAFAGTAGGWPGLGGGWAWSGDTGELDYVVSSADAAGTTTLTTVTGTNTASTSGILLQPAGSGISTNFNINADGLSINADSLDELIPGTNAGSIAGINMANVIESTTREPVWLKPADHNQTTAFNIANSTNNSDNARAFAYVCFYPSSVWNV
ncbi:MAG: hypothetical protein ACW987_08935 [Candidatus Thorarchaeota archaeon]|jgi:hypothetical protein